MTVKSSCSGTHCAAFDAGGERRVIQQRHPQPRAQLLRGALVQLRSDLDVHRCIPLLLSQGHANTHEDTERANVWVTEYV